RRHLPPVVNPAEHLVPIAPFPYTTLFRSYGVCHTVTSCNTDTFRVQSVEETFRKTNIGSLEQGNAVNLERSLRPDHLLDGHLVQIGRAHVCTPVTFRSRMPSSA